MIDVSNELKSAFLNDQVKKNIEIGFEGQSTDFSKINFYGTGETSSGNVDLVNRDMHGVIDLVVNTMGVLTQSFSQPLNEIYKYLTYAKYLYIKTTLSITSFSGNTTPYQASVLLKYASVNANGTPAAQYKEVKRIICNQGSILFSNEVLEVILELPTKPNDSEDVWGILANNLSIKFLDANGDEYPENTLASFHVTLYSGEMQLGNNPALFPYQNTTRVQYLELNMDDYIDMPDWVEDRFSHVNLTPPGFPYSLIKTNGQIMTSWGKNFGDSLFSKYVNIGYKTLYKIRFSVTSFEPIGDTPMPTHFKAIAYINGQRIDGELIEYDLNVTHETNISLTMNHQNVGALNAVYIQFINDDYTYTSSDRATFGITIESVGVYLGGIDELPYSNAIPVDKLGYDINDYLVDNTFDIDNSYLVKESFQLSESLSSTDNLKFGATESAICQFSAVGLPDKDLVGQYFRANISCEGFDEKIPLGRFRVSRVTQEGSHNIITKHIEAYDGLYPLIRDGSSWYSRYMGGINMDGTGTIITTSGQNGFNFARQMFSTLYNVCKFSGINLEFTNIESDTVGIAITGYVGKRILLEHTDPDEGSYGDSDYMEYTSNYRLYTGGKKFFKPDLKSVYDYKSQLDAYAEDAPHMYEFGTYPSNGGVLVCEFNYDDELINTYCVDDGDWFAVSDECYSLIFSYPYKYHFYMGMRLHELTLENIPRLPYQTADFNQLVSKNLAKRLVYYNWKTFEIATPSKPTLRDIIRSLVEITGHFFRYGRDGNIEFIKCDVAGLYPSNNLYPADDLYPRGGLSTEPVPMGKYERFISADKPTNHYGKIQILLNTVNEGEPATKTYIGSESKDNTYVISDNVFYSAPKVSYALKEDGSDPLPEVLEVLANMCEIIQSVYYTPCEVDAIGMPWVECGDRIGLLTEHGGFETFIFSRFLSGIQRLTDDYEARGEQKTEEVPDAWE